MFSSLFSINLKNEGPIKGILDIIKVKRRRRGDRGAIKRLCRGHQGAMQYKLGEEAMKGR